MTERESHISLAASATTPTITELVKSLAQPPPAATDSKGAHNFSPAAVGSWESPNSFVFGNSHIGRLVPRRVFNNKKVYVRKIVSPTASRLIEDVEVQAKRLEVHDRVLVAIIHAADNNLCKEPPQTVASQLEQHLLTVRLKLPNAKIFLSEPLFSRECTRAVCDS